MKRYIGAHMPLTDGIDGAIQKAISIGANTMQIFTRNPRGGRARQVPDEEYQNVLNLIQEHQFGPFICHAPYTANLAGEGDKRDFAIRILTEDWLHAQRLQASGLVVHAGSHTGRGVETGLELLINSLQSILATDPKLYPTRILVETMSGSGSELGFSWTHFQELLTAIDDPRLGICLDTCHLFAAGYDVRNVDAFVEDVAENIGWTQVGAIHLNDSKMPLKAHKDRHASLGEGEIGWPTFKTLVQKEALASIPLVLETPSGFEGWEKEIATLQKALA